MPRDDASWKNVHGPGWNDVAMALMALRKDTGWSVGIRAHVEVIRGTARLYWRVVCEGPADGPGGQPMTLTRGAFWPNADSKTVPGLLHRLLCEAEFNIDDLKRRATALAALDRRG